VDFKNDFKDGPGKTWKLFNRKLDNLRQKGWLTYWKPETGIVQRPITVVVTGEASFKDVVANITYRDVFYGEPLADLNKANAQYDSTNSYYASIPLDKAIGRLREQFTDSQNAVIVEQVQKATSLRLKTRYWRLPGKPESLKNRGWENLVGFGTSVLNVDDLVAVRNWFILRS
jgi:hypothetical protein